MVGLSEITLYLITQLCLAWLLVPLTIAIGAGAAALVRWLAEQIQPRVMP